MQIITVTNHAGQEGRLAINHYPDECPQCLANGRPTFITSYLFEKHEGLAKTEMFEDGVLQAIFQCPSDECRIFFIAIYARNRSITDEFFLCHTYPSKAFRAPKFSEEILKISQEFVTIYSQAAEAESLNLDRIAGPGYRKALEFLVKDYLSSKEPNATESIQNDTLQNLISNKIKENRLRSTAQRATWLGNDETHYKRKWITKDIDDLKILIQLTVTWVESEILTEQFNASMEKPSITLNG